MAFPRRGGARGGGRGGFNPNWEKFEQQQSNKRNKRSKIRELVVSRVAKPEGKSGSKYQPCGDRQYVPFEEYDGVTIDNVKMACEKHYQAPPGSCSILDSNTGPVCFRDDQICNKKIFLVTFSYAGGLFGDEEYEVETPLPTPKRKPTTPTPSPLNSPPPSLSLSQVLKAGRKTIDKTYEEVKLREYDIVNAEFIDYGSLNLAIDKKPFASGAFRDAYKTVERDSGEIWVLKRYQKNNLNIENTLELLELTIDEHARKHVSMHIAAKSIVDNFSKKVPVDFGATFKMDTIYLGTIKTEIVVVEKYVEGDFIKYINNTGTPCPVEEKTILEKAECLVHFSYEWSKTKLLLTDIQGSGYSLYDPEISTSDETSEIDGEPLFCIGNLRQGAIDTFRTEHLCNDFCKMLKLKEF